MVYVSANEKAVFLNVRRYITELPRALSDAELIALAVEVKHKVGGCTSSTSVNAVDA
jgi:hypothetical protein